MRTNTKRASKAKARNYGPEADAVRAMDCIVHTAAMDSGLTDGQLRVLGWTACGGAACAHHVHPRQRGGVGEGRMGLFNACARHGDEAGEASPIKGPSSKRREFEAKYGVNIIEVADAIALAHEPPLGIRGLAARWVAAEAAEADTFGWEPAWLAALHGRPAGYDLAALLSWVRRRMAAIDADQDIHATEADFADIVASDLSLRDGWPLCEQAGWPS